MLPHHSPEVKDARTTFYTRLRDVLLILLLAAGGVAYWQISTSKDLRTVLNNAELDVSRAETREVAAELAETGAELDAAPLTTVTTPSKALVIPSQPENGVERWTHAVQHKRVSLVGDSIMLQLFRYLLLQTESSSESGTATFHVPESNTTISYVSFLDGDSLDSLDDIFDESDVIIWNVGIHWHDPLQRGNYKVTIRAVGARLRSFYAERPHERVVLFRETLAQHFRTTDGSGDYDRATNEVGCVALDPTSGIGWRNIALNAIADELEIPVVPQFRSSATHHASHKKSVPGCTQIKWFKCSDCSHYDLEDKDFFDALVREFIPFLAPTPRLSASINTP